MYKNVKLKKETFFYERIFKLKSRGEKNLGSAEFFSSNKKKQQFRRLPTTYVHIKHTYVR
jgi:hypothetical protein